jgi:hypothetical protein
MILSFSLFSFWWGLPSSVQRAQWELDGNCSVLATWQHLRRTSFSELCPSAWPRRCLFPSVHHRGQAVGLCQRVLPPMGPHLACRNHCHRRIYTYGTRIGTTLGIHRSVAYTCIYVYVATAVALAARSSQLQRGTAAARGINLINDTYMLDA